MTQFTKSFLWEIYIRYNSSWNFRKTFAERYLGDSVKKYGNLFDSVSGY